MDAQVVSITKERLCQATLCNDILVVFQVPVGLALAVGDRLHFINLTLDSKVRVRNLSNGTEFEIYVASNDVHDLRVNVSHGSSRTPTMGRLRAN
jgi:hypothetical protein